VDEGVDGEPIAAVDAAWLRMDRETNPMVIAGVLALDGPVSRSEVVALFRRRLLPHRRFRQRATLGPLGILGRWEEDPLFDLEAHVHLVALPTPGGDAELGALVSELLAEPLDRRRPLWKAHVIEGVAGGTAIVMRVHHAVADGVALVRVLLDLTGEGEAAAPAAVGRRGAHADGTAAWLRARVTDAVTLTRLVALPADPPSALRVPLGLRKRVAWSGAVPLERLKEVAHAHEAKLHDVLAACVAGALRGAMADAGQPLPPSMRAVVPFYLPSGGSHDAGNHFGLVFLPLPLGQPDAHARVRAVRASMERVKASREAEVALAVLAALGDAHVVVERAVIELFSRKGSLMLTTVPGPATRVHVLGRTLRELLVWPPTSGTLGLGLSVVSYAGELRLGVVADAHIALEPVAIVRGFEREVGVLIG